MTDSWLTSVACLRVVERLNGSTEMGFVVITPPRIAAEGNVAQEELVEVEGCNMGFLLEDDAEHPPDFGIVKDQDVERCAGDPVAVMLNLFDA